MSDLQIVLLLLLLNLLIAVGYLLFHLQKEKRKKGIVVFLFLLFVPLAGALFLLCAEAFCAIQNLFGRREVNPEELSFSQSRVRNIVGDDVEKKQNLVPVEEALIVSGKTSKRGVFLDLLKEDDGELIVETAKNSVGDKDGEIAHYAATYISDALTRAKDEEKRLRKQLEEGRKAADYNRYIEYMEPMLKFGIFEPLEQRRYLQYLDDRCCELRQMSPKALTVLSMADLARRWVELEEYDRAAYWLHILEPDRATNLDIFKLCAQFYFQRGDKEALFQLFSEIRDSALELDSEALEWVRFYQTAPETEEKSGKEEKL